jgi:predicted metal-dependent phosphotriesterase family hydrolase
MPHIQTVTGPVDPSSIDGVLSHEHLLTLLPGPGFAGQSYPEQQVDAAVAALAQLTGSGVNTVVDLSPYGDANRDADGGNVVLLAEIARRSGVTVIAGTATYRDEFSPQWALSASVEELTARFVADAVSGIGGTGVRAGILGEQPTSLDRITAHEEKGLRAAARAHHLTGLAVSTHTTHGTMALEQVALLLDERVDPARVVIGHLDNHPELDYLRRVLQQGVNIAFDSIGKQYWDVRRPPLPVDHPNGPYLKDAVAQADRTRADRLAALVAEGHVGQILLSHDLVGVQAHQNPATLGRYGYRYLDTVFADLLAERGVSRRDFATMLGDNPRRLLTLPS